MIKVPLRFSYISTFFVSNFYENRRTTRITCSTVSLRFFRADAGSIASSSEQMERRIGKKASIPASLHWMASGVTHPENASTGLLYSFAILATPIGALPMTVCPSRRPSPVMTISLSRMNDSREVSSSTIEEPGSRTAFI